jgi:hypothetical protein
MACHVAGDAADDGSLDAALGFRRRDRGECQQANRCENCFHGRSPRPGWSDGSSRWDDGKFRPTPICSVEVRWWCLALATTRRLSPLSLETSASSVPSATPRLCAGQRLRRRFRKFIDLEDEQVLAGAIAIETELLFLERRTERHRRFVRPPAELVDWTYRSRRPASALWMTRAGS